MKKTTPTTPGTIPHDLLCAALVLDADSGEFDRQRVERVLRQAMQDVDTKLADLGGPDQGTHYPDDMPEDFDVELCDRLVWFGLVLGHRLFGGAR